MSHWSDPALQAAFELVEGVHDEMRAVDETRCARAELQAVMRAIEQVDTTLDQLGGAS